MNGGQNLMNYLNKTYAERFYLNELQPEMYTNVNDWRKKIYTIIEQQLIFVLLFKVICHIYTIIIRENLQRS